LQIAKEILLEAGGEDNNLNISSIPILKTQINLNYFWEYGKFLVAFINGKY